MKKHLLKVINLGKRSYEDALRAQEMMRQRVINTTLASKSMQDAQSFSQQKLDTDVRLRDRGCESECHHEDEPHNVLLLVEHWPVYTAGLRDSAFTDDDVIRLKALGADVFRTNRGGLATFHGPGQLVAYPIINLKAHGFGLKEYVARLEQTLIDTCKHFQVDAQTTDDTGVWVQDRKIASIGVNAKRYVTLHGVALNCNTNLSWYDHITPCGLEGVKMTSLSQETGNNIKVSETERYFLSSFSENFDCRISSVSDYVPAALCQAAKEEQKHKKNVGSEV